MNRNTLIAIRVTFVFMLVAATYLSLAPLVPDIFPREDKVNHAVAYAVLALTADRAFPAAAYWLPKALPLFAYGLLMEILQQNVPGRFFERLDLVANALGLVSYGAAAALILKRAGRSRSSRQ